MAERVQVRDLENDEGRKLLSIIRRGSGSVVRWRRAQIVLWSAQMHESQYPHDPLGHAADLVGRVLPGTIVLGHDVGTPDRLVATSR